MYNPTIYKITDLQEIIKFIRKYSFGLIINTRDNTPLATHLPFHTRKENGNLVIYGHFAKANKQWQSLDSGKTLIIFSEPHAYISPSHYDHEQNVPTWNYCSVHCYGTAKVIEDESKCFELLRDLIEANDLPYLSNWDTRIGDDYKSKMLKGIVMFRIEVEDIQARYKLSQNRSINEQQRVSEYLVQHSDSNARVIGEMMSKNLEMPKS